MATSEFVDLSDVPEDRKINSDELSQFYKDLDYALDQRFDKYDLDGENAYLVGVGGSSCMIYNTEQDERLANDLDFMVVHPDESNNSPQSHLEAISITEAFNELGFEFTTGKDDRRYNQKYNSTQTMENISPSDNSVPVDRVDLIGGQMPFDTYEQEWLEEYSEDLTDNLSVLEIEAITARKILRNAFANHGSEDDDQLFDIQYIRDNINDLEFCCDRFRAAWEDLVEPNDTEATYSDAKAVLMGH